ncbi:hypothetical protein [Pseudomonas sp. S2_H10]|jgi:uncharacterized phage infection (PIP) family protein YhgE
MNWLITNKEWLFSGIAISIPLAIAGFFFNKSSPKQNQNLGNNSTGYQSARDINIKKDKDDA